MVIVPLGLSMGPDFAVNGATGDGPEHWEVHLGGTPTHLSADEAKVWQAAFADPQRHARHEIDRQALEALLQSGDNGSPSTTTLVSTLLERGLLLEYDPDHGPFQDMFSGLTLFPLVQGLGNSADEPRGYRIGAFGDPYVAVDANVYAIWSYSFTSPSLWDACVGLAEGLDENVPAGEHPVNLDPHVLARDVAMVLPALVSTGSALLDPLNYEPR